MHWPEKCRLVASFVYHLLSEMLPQRSSCGPYFLMERSSCGVNLKELVLVAGSSCTCINFGLYFRTGES